MLLYASGAALALIQTVALFLARTKTCITLCGTWVVSTPCIALSLYGRKCTSSSLCHTQPSIYPHLLSIEHMQTEACKCLQVFEKVRGYTGSGARTGIVVNGMKAIQAVNQKLYKRLEEKCFDFDSVDEYDHTGAQACLLGYSLALHTGSE